MTRRTFTKDVPIEIIIEGNSVEVVATVQFSTTPYDPGCISGPPWLCYPPEGGEIEDEEVIALVLPEEKPRKSLSGSTIAGRPEIALECPAWLKETILERVSDETLNEAIDGGLDPDEARDRMRDDEADRLRNVDHEE